MNEQTGSKHALVAKCMKVCQEHPDAKNRMMDKLEYWLQEVAKGKDFLEMAYDKWFQEPHKESELAENILAYVEMYSAGCGDPRDGAPGSKEDEMVSRCIQAYQVHPLSRQLKAYQERPLHKMKIWLRAAVKGQGFQNTPKEVGPMGKVDMCRNTVEKMCNYLGRNFGTKAGGRKGAIMIGAEEDSMEEEDDITEQDEMVSRCLLAYQQHPKTKALPHHRVRIWLKKAVRHHVSRDLISDIGKGGQTNGCYTVEIMCRYPADLSGLGWQWAFPDSEEARQGEAEAFPPRWQTAQSKTEKEVERESNVVQKCLDVYGMHPCTKGKGKTELEGWLKIAVTHLELRNRAHMRGGPGQLTESMCTYVERLSAKQGDPWFHHGRPQRRPEKNKLGPSNSKDEEQRKGRLLQQCLETTKDRLKVKCLDAMKNRPGREDPEERRLAAWLESAVEDQGFRILMAGKEGEGLAKEVHKYQENQAKSKNPEAGAGQVPDGGLKREGKEDQCVEQEDLQVEVHGEQMTMVVNPTFCTARLEKGGQ